MIRYRAFTKTYSGRRVVDALTFEVPRGAVVALLGALALRAATAWRRAARRASAPRR